MSENKIIAERNGAQRPFSIEQWNNLPKDKYGWKLIDGEALPEVKDVKKATKTSYTPPEVKEIQVKQEAAAGANNNGPDAVNENKPNADANSQADADTITHVVSGDDVKANEGADLKEGDVVLIDKKDILSEKEVQLEKVRAMVAEGKDRKAVAAELGIHWQQAQKLIDQVNSQANADNKE